MAQTTQMTQTAIVVGGGIAGLLSAYQLAQTHHVTLLEASSHWGGCVRAQQLGEHLTVDAGAEAFAVRTPAVRELIDELGIADQIVAPHSAGSWLQFSDRAVPSPRLGVLGIPGDVTALEVIDALGDDGAARAREDQARPVDRWARALRDDAPVMIGELVTERMGEQVLDTLVAPVVAGVHSADPDTVEVRSVAPGLLEKTVELGSLSAAVAAQRAAAPPGAAVASLHGGMYTLTETLLKKLDHPADPDHRAVSRHLQTPAQSITGDEQRWTVATSGGNFTADRVVVATDGPTSWRLLAPVLGLDADDGPQSGAGVALVTLVIDHPGLDDAPRGTGVLVAPSVSHIGAKAMTHVSAKWDWAADPATHRHVVRLSYGRVTDDPAAARPGYATDEAALIHHAEHDVFALTGLNPTHGRIVTRTVQRWRSAVPAATGEHRKRVQRIRDRSEQLSGIDVVGAWVAGTGLAAVVADTRRTLETNSAGNTTTSQQVSE